MLASHLKLFVDGESRQAALFCGSDEHSDWLRNCPADEVLIGGWHVLPKEELMSLEEVHQRGFLQPGLLPNSAPAEQNDPLRNWQLRSTELRVRLAAQAAALGDPALEAEHAAAAAVQIGQFSDDPRQVALLLQAVEAQLTLWQSSSDPAVACAIAELFERLAGCRWPADEPEGQANSARNQRFWLGQALQRQAELSLQAETQGDLEAAASASEAVVALQLQLAALPALSPR